MTVTVLPNPASFGSQKNFSRSANVAGNGLLKFIIKVASMHSDITEGLVSKGGVGIRPKGVRPPPPKGQCTQPTDVQQLKDKIAALESRLRMVCCESLTDHLT